MDIKSKLSCIGKPEPTDFDKFLPHICKVFNIEDNVVVNRVYQEPYAVKEQVTKKKSFSKTRPKDYNVVPVETVKVSENDGQSSSLLLDDIIIDKKEIKIETVYDCFENLVQIRFLNIDPIPRKVMQVVALAIPYQKNLSTITINSGLRVGTLYELSKFLPDSNITELCLDNTFLNEAHYHILLTHGKLKYLSLARCSINDAILKTITDQLLLGYPSSTVLSALNLSTNRITDVGAKYVADMLRTNRQLSYLNLAGNMITDEGGMSILDTLQKFPLESQELSQSRIRFIAYSKKKKEFIEDTIKELQMVKGTKISKKKFSKKSKQDLESRQKISLAEHFTEAELRAMKEKAEHLAETKMESFSDPFSPSNTEADDSIVRCLGNNTLCYLNLAYNNLSYVSVRKLLEVLLTQKFLNRTPKGLVRVVIEGNLMPETCEEYEEINHIFRNNTLIPNNEHTLKTKARK